MLRNELQLLAKWVAGQTEQPVLRKEGKRIRNCWMRVLLGGSKEEALKRYFHYQQTVLLEIADDLKSVHSPDLQDCVLELHDFLLRYFKRYLDLDKKMPNAVMPAIRKQIKTAAEQLPQLPGLPLGSWLADERIAGLTYREYDYCFAVCDAVSKAEVVAEVLFSLNFNHRLFCRWYQAQLEQQWARLNAQERVALMKKELIDVRSTPLPAGMAYDLKLPSVTAQTETWLIANIQQETEQLHKLALNITVAQLALLIRMLSEEGFFATQHIAELLRFFSAHFTTKKQEHISYGSMNKLYYSADQFTAFAIRAMLLKMVGRINKMFFPD